MRITALADTLYSGTESELSNGPGSGGQDFAAGGINVGFNYAQNGTLRYRLADGGLQGQLGRHFGSQPKPRNERSDYD